MRAIARTVKLKHAHFNSPARMSAQLRAIMMDVGSKKIEVSPFGRQVSKAIRSEMGIHRMSGRELAKTIGRGETYVRERVSDEKEWALSDIAKICDAWGLRPEELISKASQ